MSAASCDGTQATGVSQDTKLRRGGGSLVIVCGHVRRQSGVGWGVSRGWDNC